MNASTRKTWLACTRGWICLGIVCLAGAVLAQAQAQAQHALTVNIPDVAPWSIHGKDEQTGIQVELIRELARRCNLRLEVVPIVYVRIFDRLRTGKSDLAVAVDSPPMYMAGRKLGIVLSVRTLIIGLHDAPAVDLNALQGKKLGIVRGTWYDERIANDKGIIKHSLVNIQQGVQMVAAGRIDYVIGTDRALIYAIANSGKDRSHFSEPLDIGKLDFALYSRSDLPEDVIRRVQEALVGLSKSTEKKTILARY